MLALYIARFASGALSMFASHKKGAVKTANNDRLQLRKEESSVRHYFYQDELAYGRITKRGLVTNEQLNRKTRLRASITASRAMT